MQQFLVNFITQKPENFKVIIQVIQCCLAYHVISDVFL